MVRTVGLRPDKENFDSDNGPLAGLWIVMIKYIKPELH
jgi:hypothetical protein